MADTLSTQELAQRWGLSTRRISQMAAAGKGPKVTYAGVGPGKGYRYALADVEAYEAEHDPVAAKAAIGELSRRVRKCVQQHPNKSLREVAEEVGCNYTLVSRVKKAMRDNR